MDREGSKRTNCSRCDLRDLADIFVGLHDALDPGDGELRLHFNAFLDPGGFLVADFIQM